VKHERCNSTQVALVNSFIVSSLVRLYAEFDGDVLEAVVLGELAQREAPGPSGTQAREDNRHCNAFAIANRTGIPRETVRRKLSSLERRGWVHRETNGAFALTAAARKHFAPWCVELRDKLRELARHLDALKPRRASPSSTR
jgi:DNA-binding MarR family transcriptional regulator